MARGCLVCLVACLAVLGMSVPGSAQTVNLSGSSATQSASESTAVGSDIATSVENVSQGVPELQEAQQLRDTQGRGAFVGAESGEQQGFIGAAEGTGTTTGAQTRRTTGRTGQRLPQTQQTRGPVIRPALVVGFAYTPRVSPAIGGNVLNCLTRVPNFGNTSSIRIRVENNVVILEGSVATPHDAALALQMVALEPGVVKVDNRLKVAAKPTGG